MLKQILKCSCVFAALVLVFSAIGALVDTDGNAATNQTLLGDIDMGVGTLGDLTAYVTNVVDQTRITDGTNTISADLSVLMKERAFGWVLTYQGSEIEMTGTRVYSSYTPTDPQEYDSSFSIEYLGEYAWNFLVNVYIDGVWYADFGLNAEGPEDAVHIEFGTGIVADWQKIIASESRLALTNDIPPAVTVVVPSTNATSGTAADAKATGMALYTGFTEWVVEPSNLSVGWSTDNNIWEFFDEFGEPVGIADPPNRTNALAETIADTESGLTATRHLVTPTKTSQLTNDGPKDGLNVGHPFATTNQIPDITSLSNRIVELENQLSGIHVISTNKYDFSTNVGLYTGVRDIIVALGGTVTNFPAIQNGGN